MKETTMNKYKKITEYPNLAGVAAFTALTAVQTVLFVMWVIYNFSLKGFGCMLLMGASIFFLLKIIVEKVIKRKHVIPGILVISIYIITLPTVASVNFNAPATSLCVTFLLLLVTFMNMYFYGEHDKRLIELVCMFVGLCALGYLNRPAFWAGVGEALIFLAIQLYRNIKTKRKNISDKSWRNTLLLFLILVIIMLLPQYFRFNGMKVVRYEKTAEEQLAARFIVPYISYDMFETEDKYLLGVIKGNEYDATHPYRDFNRLMARYAADGLDMDEIWSNLYKNTYYSYRSYMAKQYLKDVVYNGFGPFFMMRDMKDSEIKSHHGYYYGLFQNNKPVLSNKYMKFGLWGLLITASIIVLQTVGALIINLISGDYKKKLKEGIHGRIESIVLTASAGILWTLCQTLFSFAGTSYVVGIYTTITWVLITSFIWFRRE